IDCVAMNVNDLICIGAEPIALLDYLAIDKPTEHVIQKIMKGLAKGAKQAKIAIVGGETAVMPDLINGFDLAAMSVGILDKKLLITGAKIQKGDRIYGLGSTGIHSNGLTLARKVLLSRYKVSDKPKELNRSVGEELLNPTKIYVDPVLEILSKCKVHGLAHITGGAFSKLRRLGYKHGFLINNMPEPLPIFRLIQRLGNISDYEMYRTFNMGIGFCIIAPEVEQEKILNISQKNKCRFYNLGVISEKAGVIINSLKIT
ncbi:phosphoribosylformylglycinamidine cyclo-ligase, partial [[Eubacterium] cellulosolvens]